MYLLDSSYVIPELSMQMITKTEGRLHICDAYSLVLMADSGMYLGPGRLHWISKSSWIWIYSEIPAKEQIQAPRAQASQSQPVTLCNIALPHVHACLAASRITSLLTFLTLPSRYLICGVSGCCTSWLFTQMITPCQLCAPAEQLEHYD